MNPSGLRIGTPALTTRGLGEDEMREIAQVIAVALSDRFEAEREALRERTRSLMERYPLYPQLARRGRLTLARTPAQRPVFVELRRATPGCCSAAGTCTCPRSPAGTRASRRGSGSARRRRRRVPGVVSAAADPRCRTHDRGASGSSVGSKRCTCAERVVAAAVELTGDRGRRSRPGRSPGRVTVTAGPPRSIAGRRRVEQRAGTPSTLNRSSVRLDRAGRASPRSSRRSARCHWTSPCSCPAAPRPSRRAATKARSRPRWPATAVSR